MVEAKVEEEKLDLRLGRQESAGVSMGDDKSCAARGNLKQLDEDQRSNDLGLVDESEDRVLQERKIASDL